MEINHLSYSSISTWLMCPRSWKYKYIEKIPIPTSPALIFGSAVHDTVEHYIQDKSVPLSELWPARWLAQLERNETITWDDDTPEGLHNEGLRLLSSPDIVKVIDGLTCMIDEQGPCIERKVELHVPDVPMPIVGYIDMIGTDGIPHDFKTSSKSWNTDKAHNETQPLFYLAALMQAGNNSHQLRFRHVVFIKTKTPQVQVLESAFTFSEIFWLLEMVKSVWLAIETENFPCNPTGWKCSKDWCEYWNLCRGKVV